MDNYKKLLQTISTKLYFYYKGNQESYEAYDSVACAIKKYNTDILEICLGSETQGLDYKKILLQIIFDLRFSRDLDLDYDPAAAAYDYYYLMMIMEIIKEENNEFYDEFGSTHAIDYPQYEALCKEYHLVI